jgi:lysozyme family protein
MNLRRLIMDIFDLALVRTLKHEGVYSDDSCDTGGKTKWGITEIVARSHGYQGEMRNLPMETAKEIYRKDYWHKNNLDEIAKYDTDIAIKLFDIGVNMGTGTAGLFLQRVINCLSRNQNIYPHLILDGVIGTKTLEALKKLSGQVEKQVLLKMINVFQGMRYIQICERDSSQEAFIRGWFRRVS